MSITYGWMAKLCTFNMSVTPVLGTNLLPWGYNYEVISPIKYIQLLPSFLPVLRAPRVSGLKFAGKQRMH